MSLMTIAGLASLLVALILEAYLFFSQRSNIYARGYEDGRRSGYERGYSKGYNDATDTFAKHKK